MRRLLTFAVVAVLGACGTVLDTSPLGTPRDAGAPLADARVDDAGVTPGTTFDAGDADASTTEIDAEPPDGGGTCQARFHEGFSMALWTPARGGWAPTGAAPTITGQRAAQFTGTPSLTPTYLSRPLKKQCPLHIDLQLQFSEHEVARFVLLQIVRDAGDVGLVLDGANLHLSVGGAYVGNAVPAASNEWYVVTFDLSDTGGIDVAIAPGGGGPASRIIGALATGTSPKATGNAFSVGLIEGDATTMGITLLVDEIHVE